MVRKEQEENEVLDAMARVDDQRSIEEIDRTRIKRWASAFPDSMEPCLMSFEDSEKLWEEPEYQLVRRSGVSNHLPPGNTDDADDPGHSTGD
jgi:hypothetical protein